MMHKKYITCFSKKKKLLVVWAKLTWPRLLVTCGLSPSTRAAKTASYAGSSHAAKVVGSMGQSHVTFSVTLSPFFFLLLSLLSFFLLPNQAHTFMYFFSSTINNFSLCKTHIYNFSMHTDFIWQVVTPYSYTNGYNMLNCYPPSPLMMHDIMMGFQLHNQCLKPIYPLIISHLLHKESPWSSVYVHNHKKKTKNNERFSIQSHTCIQTHKAT